MFANVQILAIVNFQEYPFTFNGLVFLAFKDDLFSVPFSINHSLANLNIDYSSLENISYIDTVVIEASFLRFINLHIVDLRLLDSSAFDEKACNSYMLEHPDTVDVFRNYI
jgi:hypothetical protein